METHLLFKEESYKIIGACFEVNKTMGCGFLEAVYQECVSMEFTSQGIPFIAQPSLQLSFKGHPLKQTYEPDFLCFNEIILELKATKNLIDDFRAQTVNYLKTTKNNWRFSLILAITPIWNTNVLSMIPFRVLRVFRSL